MKFFLFVAITTILFAGLLVSTVHVFAAESAPSVDCSYTKDKKTAFCTVGDEEDLWRCDKQKNGTWKCGKVPRESGGSLPTELKKGLDLATGNSLTVNPSNDTNPTKNFMSKKGELSKQNAEISPDQENSSSAVIQ